jgi:hypothetical protein
MPIPDDISDEQLREELVSFARLILLLDRKGALLDRSASVLRLLGDLRRMVFAWEVRVTNREGPPRPRRPGSVPPAPEDSSERVVREALDRERELLDELGRETFDEDDP